MKCRCQQLGVKIGTKVKWTGISTDTSRPNDTFAHWYEDAANNIFTVGKIDHLSGWKLNVNECFVRFLECDNRSGWGLSELKIIKPRKLKVKLP